MAEYTAIALQSVAQGEDVAFTETATNGSNCIVHRNGSCHCQTTWNYKPVQSKIPC